MYGKSYGLKKTWCTGFLQDVEKSGSVKSLVFLKS